MLTTPTRRPFRLVLSVECDSLSLLITLTVRCVELYLWYDAKASFLLQ